MTDAGSLAEAFELTRDDVVQDWSYVTGANGVAEAEVLQTLMRRHHWDISVAPYHVSWLRRFTQPL